VKVKKKQTNEILRLALDARARKENLAFHLEELANDDIDKGSLIYRRPLSQLSFAAGQQSAYLRVLRILKVDIPYPSMQERK
jgi:hypothetical protein